MSRASESTRASSTRSTRDFAIHSIPRNSPHGKTGFIVFDSGNGVDGKGTFDLDDPHCKVPGTLCYQTGDVDIVDLVEAYWDSPWYNIVSIVGTAHIGTGGYLGFATAAVGSNAGSWPDGWILGLTRNVGTSQLGLNVYKDSLGHTDSYFQSQVWDKAICRVELCTVPATCTALGYNQWLMATSVCMGEGKTFSNVMISMRADDYNSVNNCSGHLELYLHSREYGLMSHQTWRRIGCDPNPPGNIGCSDGEQSMVVSPFTYFYGSTPITLERKACTRTITNGTEYVFDPRALSAPSRPQLYPNAAVVDDVGYSNILMNGQFAWRDTTIAGWTAYDALCQEVATSGSDAARYNDAAKVWCNGDCVGSSIYQDLDLDQRSPVLKGHTVDFGARVAPASGTPTGTGSIYLCQYRVDWSANGSTNVPFTASAVWPSANGTFVSSSTLIKSDTRFIRYQIYLNDQSARYVLDDAFVTRTN